MKKSNILSLVGASSVLAAASSHAQCTNQCTNCWDNLYVGLAAGGAFQQSVAIHNASGTGNGGNLKFDPGLRLDFHFGYNLSRAWSVELESGVIYNSINNFANNAVSADIYQIPVLANVIWRPWHGAFQPYIGAGCGGVFSTVQGSNFRRIAPNYNASDWTFAYQAEIGLDYAVNRSIKIGVAYEFLGTTEHDWSSGGYILKTAATFTHAVVAAFTWEF